MASASARAAARAEVSTPVGAARTSSTSSTVPHAPPERAAVTVTVTLPPAGTSIGAVVGTDQLRHPSIEKGMDASPDGLETLRRTLLAASSPSPCSAPRTTYDPAGTPSTRCERVKEYAF